MLAEAGEEVEFIKCFNDITGRGVALVGREGGTRKKLTYLRELGVHVKVDERAAVAKYNVTPIDTKWADIDTAYEGANANPFTNCCQRIQKW